MPQPDRIPLKEKVAYAVGEFPNGLPGYMPTQLASQIFNMSMGIAPSWVTGALAVFRLIDAFTDPLVGWWSDRFRSRFGRRRPFMFVGLLGMAAVRQDIRDTRTAMETSLFSTGMLDAMAGFLARVDGKSPVEYVTEEADKDRVRRVARSFLVQPAARLKDVCAAWSAELAK